MRCEEWMDDAKGAVKRGGVLSSRLSSGQCLLASSQGDVLGTANDDSD